MEMWAELSIIFSVIASSLFIGYFDYKFTDWYCHRVVRNDLIHFVASVFAIPIGIGGLLGLTLVALGPVFIAMWLKQWVF